MQVSYSKDLANHVSPEPHGVCGNAIADALVWESVGGTLSSEITAFRVPTLWSEGEGNIFHSDIASYGRTWRSLSTLACAEASCARIGRSGRFPPYTSWNRGIHSTKSPVHRRCLCFDGNDEHENRVHMEWWAGEGVMPYCRFIMPSGSRTQHSTEEAGEQEEISTSAESVEERA